MYAFNCQENGGALFDQHINSCKNRAFSFIVRTPQKSTELIKPPILAFVLRVDWCEECSHLRRRLSNQRQNVCKYFIYLSN